MGWLGKLFGRTEQPRDASVGRAIPGMPAPRVPEGAGDDTLPRFRAGAAEQLDIRRGGPLARARIRLRDAFSPSQPVADPAMFAGRLDLLSTLIGAIEDQKLHVVLYGDRGIGKTSLLHILARQAAEARYLVHYASCGEETDFATLFRTVAAEVPLLYHRGYAPTSGESERGGTLADLLPAGPVSPWQVSDLFAKLVNTRLLIILDEFDRSPHGAFRRQVAELVKTLSDRSIRVQLVIAGVALTLTELVEHIPSIRRNIMGLPVTSMTSAEIAQLIHNGERASGMRFDPEAVALITSIAAGSPYLTGLLAQHAGLSAIDGERQSVGVADIRAAIGRAADEIADRISARGRHAAAVARGEGYEDALASLSHAALQKGGRFGADTLRPLFPDGAAQTRTIDALTALGLIEPVPEDPDARLRFPEEGVPTYLWMTIARDRLMRA